MLRMYACVPNWPTGTKTKVTSMNMTTHPDAEEIKAELSGLAMKRGARVFGVADPAAFSAAPEGYRPDDILPNARSVLVVGGAQPRAGDWQSPNYQHMELTSTVSCIARSEGLGTISASPTVGRSRI